MDDYKVLFRDDHVHVQIAPGFDVTPEHRDELWSQIRETCEEHHSSRVLVEGFVPSGERETADIIAAGQRTAAIPHLWMAFHLENFVSSERSELFEVIAATRGARVKFFADTEHALQWLRHNSPS